MSHYLYLVRHGEQQDAQYGVDDGPLSARGIRQATRLADRLSGVPFDEVLTSPLTRAEETARILAERMPAIEPVSTNLLFDCVPSGPGHDMPEAYRPFFRSVTPAQIEAGEAQMSDAIEEFFSPAMHDRHTLLITHNFVIGYFVREVFRSAPWRWVGVNQVHCGLTVIRVRTVKSPELIMHNSMAHLPVEERTGVSSPVEL